MLPSIITALPTSRISAPGNYSSHDGHHSQRSMTEISGRPGDAPEKAGHTLQLDAVAQLDAQLFFDFC